MAFYFEGKFCPGTDISWFYDNMTTWFDNQDLLDLSDGNLYVRYDVQFKPHTQHSVQEMLAHYTTLCRVMNTMLEAMLKISVKIIEMVCRD